jgi:uncharacterized phosphatase
MANLYLIRHGQTDWNEQNRLQGSVERPLNEQGREQAREIGKKLSQLTIDAIYSSPMERAKETAKIIAEHHECEVGFYPGLREASYGLIEGLTHQEYHEQYKEPLAHRNSLPQEERKLIRLVEGAESLEDVATRAIPCLIEITQRHLGQNVIVVTHGGVIRVLLTYLAGHDDRNIFVSNTGLVQIRGDLEKLDIIHHEGVRIQ